MSPSVPIPHNGYLMAEKVIILLGLFLTAAFIAWLLARYHRSRAETLRLHLASRDRIVAQAGTLEALLAFARTEEGRRLLELPSLATTAGPAGLRLVQAGLVCLAMAAAQGVARHLWARAVQASGDAELIRTTLVGTYPQALLYAGAGLGLILAGWLGRYLRTRWELEDRNP
jgi:hypothetical protein